MGRARQYRNAAQKQKAYRARQKAKNWDPELSAKVEALRKKVRYLESRGHSAYIEVYKPIICLGYWYAVLDRFYHFARIDEETFEAVRHELTLFTKSHDTVLYTFIRSQTMNTQEDQS